MNLVDRFPPLLNKEQRAIKDKSWIPPEQENGEYIHNEVFRFLDEHVGRNREMISSGEIKLFDRVWIEKLKDGKGAMVWSTGLVKSDAEQFPHNSLLWGCKIKEEDLAEWQAAIEGDTADIKMRALIEEKLCKIREDSKSKAKLITDIHGWGGTQFGRMPDLRDTLLEIEKQGGDPEEYVILAQTLMGGLGTRKERISKESISFEMIPRQYLTGMANIAEELSHGDESKQINFWESWETAGGHSMGGYVTGRVALVLESLRTQNMDEIMKYLSQGYLNAKLMRIFSNNKVDVAPQIQLFNPLLYGKLDKQQSMEMAGLVGEPKRKMVRDMVSLNKNKLVKLWTSKKLPRQVEMVTNIPYVWTIFGKVINSMFGEAGLKDYGGWRKWAHLYTAMRERDYLVDCNEMLDNPVMIVHDEKEVETFRSLNDATRMVMSIGDLASDTFSQKTRGDRVLEEWTKKFFARHIGIKGFLPSSYHYLDGKMAKEVALMMLKRMKGPGANYNRYLATVASSLSSTEKALSVLG